MKRIIKGPAIFMIAAGLFIPLLGCSIRSFDHLNQEMEPLVSGIEDHGRSVRTCVLSVRGTPLTPKANSSILRLGESMFSPLSASPLKNDVGGAGRESLPFFNGA